MIITPNNALEYLKLYQQKLGLKVLPYPTILIGGTNGKGSTCSYLANILYEAGYKVGLFTSPHLFVPNERIRINNQMIDDKNLTKLLQLVKNDTIDMFSAYTFVAHMYFKQEKIDIAICEVGLGGRLDPTNLFEPEISAITTIDYDHMDFLGNTLEQIGLEKSAIFRPNKPAFIGVATPPKNVIEYAKKIGCDLHIYGSDFGYIDHEQSFDVWVKQQKFFCLPKPVLRGVEQLTNVSLAISVLYYLKNKFTITLNHIKYGIIHTSPIGRFQVLPGKPIIILDVAHNREAVLQLVQNMLKLPFTKHSYAVFGIAIDKDIEAIITILRNYFDKWFIAPIDSDRCISNQKLMNIMSNCGVTNVQGFNNITEATRAAIDFSQPDDKIICFGSFLVVRDAYNLCKN